MERDKDQLAGLDTLDNGKPLSTAVEDVEQKAATAQATTPRHDSARHAIT